MPGFALAALFGSLRRLLAVVIAGAAIAQAGFLISHKLSNPDHYAYGECPFYGRITHGPLPFPPCRPPSRALWQIPVAILLIVGGAGAAVVIAGPRSRCRAPAPELGALPPA